MDMSPGAYPTGAYSPIGGVLGGRPLVYVVDVVLTPVRIGLSGGVLGPRTLICCPYRGHTGANRPLHVAGGGILSVHIGRPGQGRGLTHVQTTFVHLDQRK